MIYMTLHSPPAFTGDCSSGAGAAADALVVVLLAVVSASLLVCNDVDSSLLFTDALSVFAIALHKHTC